MENSNTCPPSQEHTWEWTMATRSIHSQLSYDRSSPAVTSQHDLRFEKLQIVDGNRPATVLNASYLYGHSGHPIHSITDQEIYLTVEAINSWIDGRARMYPQSQMTCNRLNLLIDSVTSGYSGDDIDYLSNLSELLEYIKSDTRNTDEEHPQFHPPAITPPNSSTSSPGLKLYPDVGAAGYPYDYIGTASNVSSPSHSFETCYDTTWEQELGHQGYDDALSSDRNSMAPHAPNAVSAPILTIRHEAMHPMDYSLPLKVPIVTITRTSKNTFKCNRCQTVITRERDAHRHATSACPNLTEEEKTRVFCAVCQKDFSRRDTWLRHMFNKHGIDVPKERPGRKTIHSIA